MADENNINISGQEAQTTVAPAETAEVKPEKPEKPEKKPGGFKKSFTSRQFRNGGYSLLFCVIALVIVIVLNMIVSALPSKYTRIDATTTKLFSISDQTENLISAIDEDVTVYFLTTENAKDATISNILDRYADLSDHIKLVQIDPTTNPYFAQKYTDETIYINSVIIESAERFRVVGYYDIYQYTYNYDYTTGATDESYNFDGENQLTSAIDYVLTDDLPKIYTLEGHGETALSDLNSEFENSLALQNIETASLNLLSATEIPEDAAALVMVSPTSDISNEQYSLLLDYLENGGRLLLYTDLQNGVLPNLNDLMKNYGVTATEEAVLEGDSTKYIQYVYFTLPNLEKHEITDPLTAASSFVLVPIAHNISVLPTYRSTLTVTPLLTTSESAYGRVGLYDSETLERTEFDTDGPFNEGVAISEKLDENSDVETRIVWYSSCNILLSNIDDAVSGSNTRLALNSISWLVGDDSSSVVIDAKALTGESLTVAASAARTWAVALIVAIPLAIVAYGVVVFISRRKK